LENGILLLLLGCLLALSEGGFSHDEGCLALGDLVLPCGDRLSVHLENLEMGLQVLLPSRLGLLRAGDDALSLGDHLPRRRI